MKGDDGQQRRFLAAGVALAAAVPTPLRHRKLGRQDLLMHIDTESGLLMEARQVASPNCDDRPAGTTVDLLIIHGMSLPPGVFGGPHIDQLFTNVLDPSEHPYFATIADRRVSAHLLIRRDGELVQYVPFRRRAWHAGKSSFDGRDNCNDYSIGVELEGADDTAYTGLQYRRLSELYWALRSVFPAILPDRVVGHRDVAPGRKTDPGPSFDWTRLRQLLNSPAPSAGPIP